MDEAKLKWIRDSIRDVPDFPKPGILFKDITTLIRDPRALTDTLDLLVEPFVDRGITAVVGMESRGFIFGVPVAERLGVGFVPVRKPGKLPAETVREEYELEYGTDSLEMHKDAVGPGDRVLVVDDLLATGGTAEATVRMIRKVGAEIAGAAFVIELGFLEGRAKLGDLKLHSLVVFD
ncbi:MAG: adenine phosphoribosyltransferase [Deltaproteobacteria bacterium]|nr:adenine phosphoribosyltransferase [Deltaproteobacteria bacterium]